ncbi:MULTISPECIES: hypothetical protein [Pseudomonas]|uniref:Uncharacterized protein n=1 Tax=Pseudomonas lutea TaxID=243924 RepID=A0A9X8MH11_9PSED|nr:MULTISPECIES: hypothetical protein [Pseudomonas]SER35588.1 hypothetical protein SAMN05216409_11817 [Pseudomonas lutea]
MNDTYSSIQSAANSGAFGINGTAQPSLAQTVAGTYKKGRVSLYGLDIAIETPQGQRRIGKTDGAPWSVICQAHYGYISGYVGADGDDVDCYVGPVPESNRVFVVNQNGKDGSFDEHKVMLAFADEESARTAYMNSYQRGWTGLGSIVNATVAQFCWWLKFGDTSKPFTSKALPYDSEDENMTNIIWDSAAEPVSTSLATLLYGLRREDTEGLLLDAVSVADILEDSEGVVALDALVVVSAKLQTKMEQIQRVMEGVGEKVKPVSLQITGPFRQKGTTNICAVFELSDGQTVAIFFHNPDSTPNKILPTDELVSWKWLLNKRDITILVAPENGRDLNPREVARRVMKLAEKNSDKFAKANTARAERLASIESNKTVIAQHEDTLRALDAEIEDLEAKVAAKRAIQPPQPGSEQGATEHPEPVADFDVAVFLANLAQKYGVSDSSRVPLESFVSELEQALPATLQNRDAIKQQMIDSHQASVARNPETIADIARRLIPQEYKTLFSDVTDFGAVAADGLGIRVRLSGNGKSFAGFVLEEKGQDSMGTVPRQGSDEEAIKVMVDKALEAIVTKRGSETEPQPEPEAETPPAVDESNPLNLTPEQLAQVDETVENYRVLNSLKAGSQVVTRDMLIARLGDEILKDRTKAMELLTGTLNSSREKAKTELAVAARELYREQVSDDAIVKTDVMMVGAVKTGALDLSGQPWANDFYRLFNIKPSQIGSIEAGNLNDDAAATLRRFKAGSFQPNGENPVDYQAAARAFLEGDLSKQPLPPAGAKGSRNVIEIEGITNLALTPIEKNVKEAKSPADRFKVAFDTAAKKDIRSYLNGVHVDEAGKLIVSTDGHRMMVISDVDLAGVPKKSEVAKQMGYTVVDEKGNWIEGRYPDWSRVMPTSVRSGELRRFTSKRVAAYARAALKALRYVTVLKFMGVRVEIGDRFAFINASYLLDMAVAFQKLGYASFKMTCVANSGRDGQIYAESDDGKVRQLVMGMRMQSDVPIIEPLRPDGVEGDKAKKTDERTHSDWQAAIISGLAEKLDITESDADAIVMANAFVMTQEWTKGTNAEGVIEILAKPAEPEPEPAPAPQPEPAAEPEDNTVNEQDDRTGEARAYLQSVIDGQVDFMDTALADRLEAIASEFGLGEGGDSELESLFEQAAMAYSDAVVAAAKAAL